MRATKDPYISLLQGIIRLCVYALATLMTLIIIWGVFDVLYMLYTRLQMEPKWLLNISDILATFGAFIAVLIAIEIFVNITMYLKDGEELDYVRLILATALMAIARKVIVFDFKEVEPSYVYGTGLVILALGFAYWLVALYRPKRTGGDSEKPPAAG